MAYQTEDGRIFDNQGAAQEHANRIEEAARRAQKQSQSLLNDDRDHYNEMVRFFKAENWYKVISIYEGYKHRFDFNVAYFPDAGLIYKSALENVGVSLLPPNFTGKGKKVEGNGNVYEGDFVDGEPHGKGKMTYEDGSVYEGDWVYKSDWYESKEHGTGKYYEDNGNVYEGSFSKGVYCGFGKMIYANGDVYEGNWSVRQHGKGKMTYKNGKVEEGNWKQGVFQG